MSKAIVTTSALLAGALSTTAMAAEPKAEGEASAGISLSTRDGAAADGSGQGEAAAEPEAKTKPKRSRAGDRSDRPWIRRWAPERNTGEVGLYGGVLLPSRRLELFEPDTALPNQGFKTFGRVAPDVGLRLGYTPIRFFAVEGEAGVMPTRTQDDLAATLWAMRLSFVGQLGLWSVTPFVLAGGGMLNVSSDRAAAGRDVDASLHFGGGVKVYLTRYTQLRLDIRDNITAGQGVDEGVIHNPEVLLGFSVVLGRKREKGPVDTDGDGILDPDDECVDVPGVVEYQGCPIPDTDGDGILDPQDQCISEPETRNGFQDTDGCPDEVPKEIEKFSGVIEGIFFDTDKDTIKAKSETVLNEALDVLKKFPELRVEISGHTDSRGGREHNVDLSQRRADAVKQWMIDHGIEGSRMTTRGAGPDEPIDSNETKAGRDRNRRIEFKLLTQ